MHMSRFSMIVCGAILCIALSACQTNAPGVRSTGFAQYTTIGAGTAQATKAAEEVLQELGLQEIQSNSTNVDGWATGQMADKTPVKVSLSRVSEGQSEISVKVGSFGDNALGKDILARVRDKLGLPAPTTETATPVTTK